MKLKVVKRYIIKALDCLNTYRYGKEFRRIMKVNELKNIRAEGEEEWVKKWGVLGKPDRCYYRLYTNYIGPDINIVPQNLCHNIVELVLCPYRFAGYYADKNAFDRLFPQGYFPKTILRKMQGRFFDKNYSRVVLTSDWLNERLRDTETDYVMLKPSIDGMSGIGVQKFVKTNGRYKNVKSGQMLTSEYLQKVAGDNIIIQEGFVQHSYLEQFCRTSVNTIRLTLYRSVRDEQCHVTSAIMRMGRDGNVVDNLGQGGSYIGIQKDTGILDKSVRDQDARIRTVHNGIDFSANHFQIPHWDKILEFAKSVGQYIPHHRLLALDIVLDINGKPAMLEFNIEGYNPSIFQFTLSSAWGEYTDEIIEYCCEKLKTRERVLYLGQ